MSGVFDPTMRAVLQGMDVRARRQSILASNLANLDTPHFVPKDLDFKAAMKAATAAADRGPLARTNPAHLTGDGVAAIPQPPQVSERPDCAPGRDGNAVDLDRQLAKATLNAGVYGALARAAQKKIAALKYVMQP